MTSQKIYKKFLLKVNKNDTNANVKIPKSQFVLLFNEQKDQWQNDIIKNNEDSDYIEEIQELLELDTKLIKINSSLNKDNFKLPDDFSNRVTAYAITSKEKCKNNQMVIWFVKPKNRDIYLQNSNLSPSFEYQETFAIINNKQVSIFKDTFNIDEVYLSYYRQALDIDIAGYINIDGTPSTDKDTDLSDPNIDIILNRTAAEALRNYENIEQLQIAATRPLI
jgi:hypothetical protein